MPPVPAMPPAQPYHNLDTFLQIFTSLQINLYKSLQVYNCCKNTTYYLVYKIIYIMMTGKYILQTTQIKKN